ncbi:MAG: serine dehydratase subunit alpha family protein [Bacteroidales bacterium]|jgi:L-cysteine desulfidase
MITNEQIIELLKEEAKPALGCTEPVACAYACAKCYEILKDTPDFIEVEVSGNILKNGMGVGIPGTGMIGLPIAVALGVICGKTEYGLEVLKDVLINDNLTKAKELLNKDIIRIKLAKDAPDILYVKATCIANNNSVSVTIQKSHTNIVEITYNGTTIFSQSSKTHSKDSNSDLRSQITIERIWEFVNNVNTKDIEFLLEGAKMNKEIALEGKKNDYGYKVGKTLLNYSQGKDIDENIINRSIIFTTAASDARMDGCPKPVMTNSGSGNQGLTVYLPILVSSETLNSSEEDLIKALAISNLVATHAHYYNGHLSAFCGLTIAGLGAASGISYLLDKDYSKIINTIKGMISNISGMMCDGAKTGCSLKVYSSVSAAVLAAIQSHNNIFVFNDGIVDEDIETTIQNLGKISNPGMVQTDKTIIDIMDNKVCN